MTTGNYKHKPHSEETKRKISESRKGQKHSVEARKKHADKMRGRSIKHEGQFKKGQKAWNYQGKETPKRKRLRKDGKLIQNSHYVYMTYHNLKEIPKGFIIHHIDENPLNDNVSNLKLMWAEDHSFLHNMIDKERYKTTQKVLKLKLECKTFLPYFTCGVIIKKIDEIFGAELTK